MWIDPGDDDTFDTPLERLLRSLTADARAWFGLLLYDHTEKR